jgi:glycosyltransferase involved in cell wall biosynthesis
LIAHNFYQQPGGEDRSFAAEAEALRAGGHELTEYVVHNDSIHAMGRAGVAARTLWNRDAYRELRALIRRTRPEVAHFNNTFPLISPAAYYAARAEGVPVVQSLRNYRLLCANALFFRDGRVCEDCLGKSVPWPAVVHACYRDSRAGSATVSAMLTAHRAARTWTSMVDVYVALTNFARRKLVEGGLPDERMVVKPNFVHPDPGPGDGRGGYVLFVGRLSAEKGLRTLLAAWELMGARNAPPLKIVGDGPMAADVAAACRSLPNVQWLGAQSPTETYRIMGEAAALALTSEWYEPFGRVAVEAFATGTPVIASKMGAMTELIDPGRTGVLFAPGNARDLADAVTQLFADKTTLARMRAEVRKEFLAKFTASQNLRQMLAIYERARESFARRPATARSARGGRAARAAAAGGNVT